MRVCVVNSNQLLATFERLQLRRAGVLATQRRLQFTHSGTRAMIILSVWLNHVLC
jgi:hypothetical protein